MGVPALVSMLDRCEPSEAAVWPRGVVSGPPFLDQALALVRDPKPMMSGTVALMKPNRYKIAAELLGGKHKRGIVGRSRPRIEGRIGRTQYTLTSTWELETKTETYGVLRTKERKSYKSNRGHIFHLHSVWLPVPCTIRSAGGRVSAVSAVPGETILLSDEQQKILAATFSKWSGIEITNHGIEWEEPEREQTAQEFALTIEGLAGMLNQLPTEKDSVATRIASKARLPSGSGLSEFLKNPRRRAVEGESVEDVPDHQRPEAPLPDSEESSSG